MLVHRVAYCIFVYKGYLVALSYFSSYDMFMIDFTYSLIALTYELNFLGSCARDFFVISLTWNLHFQFATYTLFVKINICYKSLAFLVKQATFISTCTTKCTRSTSTPCSFTENSTSMEIDFFSSTQLR